MRQLTGEQDEAMRQARTDLMSGCEYDGFTKIAMSATYRQAWKDCLDYQQSKFAALFQQLKGLLEMGALINDKSVEELVKELENETTN